VGCGRVGVARRRGLPARPAEHSDDQVAQAGHDAGPAPCGPASVLGEGDTTDVVQRLDARWPQSRWPAARGGPGRG
jgi:hypothetical protein